MFGLVVATHGRLAEELVATAEGIVGPIANVVASHVAPAASAVEIGAQLRDAVVSVDQGQGVLILADLLGGSPCAQSLPLCAQRQVEVVTGVNLPMLLDFLHNRALPPDEGAARAAVKGTDAIRKP